MDKLLIVSDNHKITTALVRLLQEEYSILTVANDIAAVNVVSKGCSPAKIIIEGRGYADIRDVLLRLRDNYPLSRIVFISSYLCSEDREDLKAGVHVDSLLIKPCNKGAIIKALKSRKKDERKIDSRLIHSIVEAYGTKNCVLSRCYSRVSSILYRLDSYIDTDLRYVHDLLVYYLSVITTLDEDVITDLLSGCHVRKEAIPRLVAQLERIKSLGFSPMDSFDTTPITDMLYINKKYNGKGLPDDGITGEKLPIAARILRVLFDFHYLEEKGKSCGEAVFILNSRPGWYDENVLNALVEALGDEARFYNREVFPLGLQVDMVMAQDLHATIDGKQVLLIKHGQVLSEHNIDYIHRHAQDILDITEPILIRESVLLCEEQNA